jgi:hypothetical protein
VMNIGSIGSISGIYLSLSSTWLVRPRASHRSQAGDSGRHPNPSLSTPFSAVPEPELPPPPLLLPPFSHGGWRRGLFLVASDGDGEQVADPVRSFPVGGRWSGEVRSGRRWSMEGTYVLEQRGMECGGGRGQPRRPRPQLLPSPSRSGAATAAV